MSAEVLSGPVMDLNVIDPARPVPRHHQVHSLSAPVTVHNGESSTVLIATEQVDVEYQGIEHKLQPRDAVLLRGESAARLAPSGPRPALFHLIEIVDLSTRTTKDSV